MGFFSIHFRNISTTRHENKLKSLKPASVVYESFAYPCAQIWPATEWNWEPRILFIFVSMFLFSNLTGTAPSWYAFNILTKKHATESGPWTIDIVSGKSETAKVTTAKKGPAKKKGSSVSAKMSYKTKSSEIDRARATSTQYRWCNRGSESGCAQNNRKRIW